MISTYDNLGQLEATLSPTEYRLFKDSPSELISNTIDKQ